MKTFALLLLSTLSLCISSFALEPAAQAEVDYLIGYVEKSGYRFIRGGKEYSSAEGAAHLRMKLGNAGGRVKTADDFVLGVGTKSYLTGSAYLVKTPEGKSFPTGPWLTEALAKYRKTKPSK